MSVCRIWSILGESPRCRPGTRDFGHCSPSNEDEIAPDIIAEREGAIAADLEAEPAYYPTAFFSLAGFFHGEFMRGALSVRCLALELGYLPLLLQVHSRKLAALLRGYFLPAFFFS